MRPRSSLALAGALLVTLRARHRHGHPIRHLRHRRSSVATDGRVLLEDALTDEIRTDNADAPDASILVPQDGAVVDDVDHRLNETRDPS